MDGKMYVYEADGQCGTAMFWKDGIRWNWVMDFGTEDLAAITFTFPARKDWTDVGAHCLMASTEEYLREYIEGYTPETVNSDVEIEKSLLESDKEQIMVLHGFSSNGDLSSKDLAWYALQEEEVTETEAVAAAEYIDFEPVEPLEAQPVDVYVPFSGRAFNLILPEEYQPDLIQFVCNDGHGIYFNEYTGRFTAKKAGRFTVVLSYGGKIQILHIQVGQSSDGAWIEGERIDEVFTCSAFDVDTLKTTGNVDLRLNGLYFDFPERPAYYGEAYLTRDSVQGGLIETNISATVHNSFSHFSLFYFDGSSAKYDSIGTLMWNRNANEFLIQTTSDEYIGYPAETEAERESLISRVYSAENE